MIQFHKQSIFRFDGKNMSVWGYEMLVRYPHPQLLNPYDTELDWEIFRAAWDEIPNRPLSYWNINLFPTTFLKHYDRLVRLFAASVNKKKAKRIYIELVEICPYSLENGFENPHKLPVILDDFGTGFSNLDLYLSLNPLAVKFDRIFFQLPEETMRSLVQFVKNNCRFVIFEKIETWEELMLAHNCGFDLFQGFYLDKAVPLSNLWEKNNNSNTKLFCNR